MRRFLRKKWVFVLALAGSMHFAQAQIEMPQASPKAILKTKVGLTDVEVEYSRPGLKGRDKKIFGELAPYGQVWRTGANEATKITFNDNVKINGKDLAAGTYALLTIPDPDEWTVIFNTNLGMWGNNGYNEKDDVLRVKVKPTVIPYPKETFTIDFASYTNDGADLTISWDNVLLSIPVETEVDSRVMASIEKEMQKDNIQPMTYFRAATYYQQNNKDLNQALKWIDTAIQNREHFLFYNVKSKILADMKKYKEAIKAAEKSRELAQKDNNPDYVKINNDLIARYKERK